MKRRLNLAVWLGFLVVVAAALTYVPVFSRFPATRDFPWANLLMFGAGLALIALGLRRAFREPALYRGKVAGSIVMGLGVALLAFFCFGLFYLGRQLPASSGAPRVGQKAPDFTLPDKDGSPVTLSKLLDTGASGADRVNGVPFAHAGGGPGGADIARPAEFLIDSTGTVRWVNLTDSILVRARPEQILKEVDGLGLATPRGK